MTHTIDVISKRDRASTEERGERDTEELNGMGVSS